MKLDDFRAIFLGALYVLGAAIALSATLHFLESTIVGLVRRFRDPHGGQFSPCALLDCYGRPCFLPADHLDREHATQWADAADRNDLEKRHRFDDTGSEGRTERRMKPGPAYMPRVTRNGDPVAAKGARSA